MKYTKSALLDSFDFIKKFIYVLDLLIQIGYVSYMIYRLVNETGYFISNIILLIVSFGYLVYHLATTKEFYTYEEKENKTIIKKVIKVIKRIVNFVVIVISVSELVVNPELTNSGILATMVMILGFVLSIFGDIVIILIDSKVAIIVNSLKYDLDLFREEHIIKAGMLNVITKKFNFDINTVQLTVDEAMLEKVKKVNYKQEQKARRKKDFKKD